MSSCLDGVLRDECGVFGDCVESVCECSGPWFGDLDYVPGNVDVDRRPCDSNRSILDVVHVVLLISSLMLILIHLVFITKRSQLIRLLPMFTGVTGSAIFSVIRLVDPSQAVFRDVVVTFLVAYCFLAIHTQALIFFSKYVSFQLKMAIIKPTIVKVVGEAVTYRKATFAVDVAFSVLLLFPLFLEHAAAMSLIRIVFAIGALRDAFSMAHTVYMINLLLADLDVKSEPNTVDPSVQQLKEKCKMFKNIRVHVIWYYVFNITCFAFIALFPVLIPLFKYTIPIIFMSSHVVSWLVLFNYQRSAKLGFKSKKTPKGTAPVSSLKIFSQTTTDNI